MTHETAVKFRIVCLHISSIWNYTAQPAAKIARLFCPAIVIFYALFIQIFKNQLLMKCVHHYK